MLDQVHTHVEILDKGFFPLDRYSFGVCLIDKRIWQKSDGRKPNFDNSIVTNTLKLILC